jgi:hypothetical protein
MHACTCTGVCMPEVLSMCNKHLMLGQTAVIYTHTYTHSLTHIQHFHSSTALCKQPRETHTLTEAMKARLKSRVAGPTTGCWTNEATCIEEDQRVRHPAVRCHQKNTPKKIKTYIHTHTHTSMHVCMYDCMRSESESASHLSPPQLKGVRVISACVRACAC